MKESTNAGVMAEIIEMCDSDRYNYETIENAASKIYHRMKQLLKNGKAELPPKYVFSVGKLNDNLLFFNKLVDGRS
jgi:hypothetical protein